MTNRDSTEPLVVAPTLRAAYEAAEYEVLGRGAPVVLRIGARTPGITLDEALVWRRVAVITAWNPFSTPTSAEANAARQARLVREVERARRTRLSALGRDPAGQWAPEPSLAVFDPSDDELDDWLLAFGQNAVVVAEADGTCELRFHPHERARLVAEGPSAERAAARLWASAWETLELDLLDGALDDDVVYTSQRDVLELEGRAVVCAHLRGALRTPGGEGPHRARVSATVGDTPPGEPTRPCAMMFEGEAKMPSAVVHFTLRRGSIARIDVCAPELPWRRRPDDGSSGAAVRR